ncbi:polysaccharide pyruvyl transferase family protein [Vibrio natriegens]|uniref:polysaccharide pyruvyl transferase family protein n=1 Tax=Vibrio natriegens TaxID=691 RepID=UPI00159354CA|nr:polysaccharide pyruvyl transferase family protein [Vibrio natriegens]NVC92202.1 polysaccharide pyruvyl transferase family protein [Vibrio natriegens]
MKIAITGPLADRNLGDYGMFINNLYDISPKNEFVVFSYNSSFVDQLKTDYLKGFSIDFVDVELLEKRQEKLDPIEQLKKLRRVLLGKEKPYYPTPLELLNRCSNISAIEKEIENSDILLVSGGGYFNDLWFEWTRNDDLFKIIVPILIAAKMNKKIVFTANGFGPFDSSKHFYEMIFAEAKDAIITSRDRKLSPTYLADLGVKEITYLPDDLYIINDGINPKEQSKSSRYGKYMIFEQYGNINKFKENIESIRSLVAFFKNKGLNVVFLTFDVDETTTSYLKEEIKEENFFIYDFETGYLKINDAIELIKNSELVLCNRYHALVLSVTNQIPVINVIKPVFDLRYYYNKNSGLLDNAFEGVYFNYNEYMQESLSGAIQHVIDNYDSIIRYQNSLYSSSEFSLNKENLANKRIEFFSTHFQN